MKFAALVLALLLSGCASKEALPNYYVLTPTGVSRAGAARGARVFIRRITAPGYLAGNKLASRRADNQIEYSANGRWAEGLTEALARGLGEALSRRPGIGAVTALPAGAPPPRDYDLQLDVERCEGDDQGNVTLAARWSLYRPESPEAVASRRSVQVRPGWKTGDDAALASLLSEDIAGLAAEIARAIR